MRLGSQIICHQRCSIGLDMHVAISLTIVPLKQSISLLTTPTFSVHMTGQAFCVELARKGTV